MFSRLRESASMVYNRGGLSSSTSDDIGSKNNIAPATNEDDQVEDHTQSHTQAKASPTSADTSTNISNENSTNATNDDTSSNTTNDDKKLFSIIRSSDTTEAIQTESNHLENINSTNTDNDTDTKGDTSTFLSHLSKEKMIAEPVNHDESSTKDTQEKSRTEMGKMLFSRMRLSASKAFEVSTTKLNGTIYSGSHHTVVVDTATEGEITTSPSDLYTTTNDDVDNDPSNHLMDNPSEEILNDPGIRHIVDKIHQLQYELNTCKESGKHAQKRRQQEHGTLKQHSNSKTRELWFATQKMRRFIGLGDYKTELKRCSLPAHDTSAPTLTLEAKLLRAQHQGGILDHQLAIIHELQQSMIDFLYTKALPDIKAEQELATMVGRSQLNKMIKAQDTMVELFEECLGLQRKIIAKYRLREIEHSRGMGDEQIEQEVEHLRVITGEIPAMERKTELRDSAKQRLEERLQVKDRQLERRRSREEDLIKTTNKIIDDEKEMLGKANEHIANISNHSIDLLLHINDDDDDEHDENRNKDGGTMEDGMIEANKSLDNASRNSGMAPYQNSMGELGGELQFGRDDDIVRTTTATQNEYVVPSSSPSDRSDERAQLKNAIEPSTGDHSHIATTSRKFRPSGNHRISTAGVSHLRARHADREMDTSERSFASISNHDDSEYGVSEHGVSEHSNSEGADDHLPIEHVSPRTNRRAGVSGGQQFSTRGSTNARSRTDLLERARAARLNNNSLTSVTSDHGTPSMRPSLGARAMSSRDFQSRRPSAVASRSIRGGLGGSEHQAALLASSDPSARARPSLTTAADRHARMERLANRRRMTANTVTSGHQQIAEHSPSISIERRAQLRAAMSDRIPMKEETTTDSVGHENEA